MEKELYWTGTNLKLSNYTFVVEKRLLEAKNEFKDGVEMIILWCNSCGRLIGKEEMLGTTTVRVCHFECCPECQCTKALMDVDYSINDNDEILEEFLGFHEGTDRMEIWHWFDERYSKGVAYLMFGSDAGKRIVCKRCGAEVQPEEDEVLRKEYPYYCPKCDENMYSFECEEVEKE